MAAAYILNQGRLEDAEQLTDQLQHALDSRVVVEQTKGIVAERHGCDPEAAFGLLRGYARPRNLRVHDVAERIVAGDLDL